MEAVKSRYSIVSYKGLVTFGMWMIGVLWCPVGHAQNPNQYPIGKPDFTCVQQEAYNHQIPLAVLLAINSIERGNTGQSVANTNKSQDLGAFQINTIHLPMIAQKFKGSKEDVMNRGCFNARIAAYLVREAIHHPKKQHLDFYTRAAGYHSWTPKFNQLYRKKLIVYTKQWQSWLCQQIQYCH